LTGNLIRGVDERLVKAASVRLIRNGRIIEPVAQNHGPPRKRRSDHLMHDLGARRFVDEQFRHVRHRTVFGVEHDIAQLLADSGPARLTKADDLVAFFLQRFGKESDMSRFTGPFSPFERYEHTGKRSRRFAAQGVSLLISCMRYGFPHRQNPPL